MSKTGFSRRTFLGEGSRSVVGALAEWLIPGGEEEVEKDGPASPGLGLGVVASAWLAEWDVATLLRHLERAGLSGVELEAGPGRHISPQLSRRGREENRLRFANGRMELASLGVRARAFRVERRLEPDQADILRSYLQLGKDLGAGCVSVQLGRSWDEVEEEAGVEVMADAVSDLERLAAESDARIRVRFDPGRSKTAGWLVGATGANAAGNVMPALDLSASHAGARKPAIWPGIGAIYLDEESNEVEEAKFALDELLKNGYDIWIFAVPSSDPDDRIQALLDLAVGMRRLVDGGRFRKEERSADVGRRVT